MTPGAADHLDLGQRIGSPLLQSPLALSRRIGFASSGVAVALTTARRAARSGGAAAPLRATCRGCVAADA